MVYISRRAEFSASHRLFNPEFSDAENDAIYGRCNNPNGHGHNYVMEVTLRGRVAPDTGMVMDLKHLKQVIDDVIIDKVDHRHLNYDVDFLAGIIPTAENIAVAFWQQLEKHLGESAELYEVRVWESDNNVAWYRGEGAELVRHGEIAGVERVGR